MRTYLIKRLLLMLITLAVITLVSYTMIRAAPGDPTRSQILGDTDAGLLSEQSRESPIEKQLREDFFLDRLPARRFLQKCKILVVLHPLPQVLQ